MGEKGGQDRLKSKDQRQMVCRWTGTLVFPPEHHKSNLLRVPVRWGGEAGRTGQSRLPTSPGAAPHLLLLGINIWNTFRLYFKHGYHCSNQGLKNTLNWDSRGRLGLKTKARFQFSWLEHTVIRSLSKCSESLLCTRQWARVRLT